MKYIILLFTITTFFSCKNNNDEDDITYLVSKKQELLDTNYILLNQVNSLILQRNLLEEEILKLEKYKNSQGLFVDL